MKGKDILEFLSMEDEDSSLCGLLGQRLFSIRKKVSVPPSFVVSSNVFRDLVEESGIPEEKYIPWELELDMANRFGNLESPVARILPSPSYEHSIPPFSMVTSKSGLVLGVDLFFRSIFEPAEVKKREEMDVGEFDVAVIFQKLFDAKCSGFLVQSEKETQLTAIHGLPIEFQGEDTIVVDNEGKVLSHSEAEQKKKWVLEENDVLPVDIEEESRDSHKLTEKQITRLASLGWKTRQIFKEPMTVGWYLVRNTFYVSWLYPSKIELPESY
jgi:phosphoenolpyruvate synthase/pyruvate phosphate dikinase